MWEILYADDLVLTGETNRGEKAGGRADVCPVEGDNGTKRPEGEHGEDKADGQ